MRADFLDHRPPQPGRSRQGPRGHLRPRHHARRHRHPRPAQPRLSSWFKTSGIISPEKWGNLPGGECFTAPGEVNGSLRRRRRRRRLPLRPLRHPRATSPLTINIEGNRITRVSSDNKDLERDFWAYTHTDENSDRVGEFAIGTNIGVERVIGNILQDEKFPGIHIAFGNPYGAHTGAPWKSSTHIDVVGLEFNIWLGGPDGEEQIMRDGQFLLEV